MWVWILQAREQSVLHFCVFCVFCFVSRSFLVQFIRGNGPFFFFFLTCLLSTTIKDQMVVFYGRPRGSLPPDGESSGQRNTLWGLAVSFLLSPSSLKPLARRALRKFLFQTEASPWARPLPLTSAQAYREETGWRQEELDYMTRLRSDKWFKSLNTFILCDYFLLHCHWCF